MSRKRFRVILEWHDASDKDWCDADEIHVWARSAAGATSKARAQWLLTKGAEWPRCVLTRVWVMTREKYRNLIGA